MTADFIEAAAAHYLEAERVGQLEEPANDVIADMRAELDPYLQQAWDDPSDVQALLTGRRRGKTEYLARRLLRGAMLVANSINPYILPTAKQARMVCWPILHRVTLRHVPDAQIREHEMTIRIPGRGTIIAGGCDHRGEIGKWYGMPFAEADVDECGIFPEYLADLIDESLEPGTMDYGGKMAFAGNPGPILSGYWFDMTGPQRTSTVPLYQGDARDNPHLQTDVDAFFAKVLKRNGWTWETPTFQRMYLGHWCEDVGALVFPFVLERNSVDALPKATTTGVRVDHDRWRYVIGVDVGVVDATAISIVGSHPMLLDEYVVHTEAHTGWISGQLAERLREIRAMDVEGERPYTHAPIVLDTGGMGKLHAEELTRRYALGLEPAEKREKESNVRETRDRLISGRIKLLNGPPLDPLRDEWSVLGWDDDKRLPNPNQPDHVSDATLYALRRLRHYTRAEPKPKPKHGTPEWYQAERDAMFDRQQRKVRRANRKERRPQWDR